MGEYQRKSREDRIKEIHRCALGIFLEKGYKNTTMEDIVAASSLSKGGLYHYYGSTKDILFDMMRQGNYDFIEGNMKIDPGITKDELCSLLTEAAVKRILQPTPARRLYLMFAYEMLYDPDFEEIYLHLEKEAFLLIEKAIRMAMPDFCLDLSIGQPAFFSRLLNALLLAQNLFSDRAIFGNAREQLYNILYKQCMTLLDQSP